MFGCIFKILSVLIIAAIGMFVVFGVMANGGTASDSAKTFFIIAFLIGAVFIFTRRK